MKTDIHPKFQTIKFSCSCGASYEAGSTLEKDFKTEICSNCHPFYTGEQKLIDKSGRVDKFLAKRKKAQELAEKKVKKVKKGEAEEVAKLTAEEEVEEVNEELGDNTVEMKEAKQEKADKKEKKTEKEEKSEKDD